VAFRTRSPVLAGAAAGHRHAALVAVAGVAVVAVVHRVALELTARRATRARLAVHGAAAVALFAGAQVHDAVSALRRHARSSLASAGRRAGGARLTVLRGVDRIRAGVKRGV